MARSSRLAVRLGVLAALALIVLIGAALVPGGASQPAHRAGVRRVAGTSGGRDALPYRERSVVGTSTPASRYGTIVGDRENEGSSPTGQLVSDLVPLSAVVFERPIAAYRAYAERWAAKLAGAIAPLSARLQAGDRMAARRAWETAFWDYLHLGAVYGLLPAALQRRLAGLPGSYAQRDFVGLHRIELGLWRGADPRSLAGLAAGLRGTVAQLRRVLPHVAITPLAYATRAHEILEDAQRDLLSGAEVPWSGAGVLGTAAGLAVTREVIATLTPLMQGRDNTLEEVDNWLDVLGHTLAGLRRAGGSWPALGQLGMVQRERLNGVMAGTLGALAAVPGTLETTNVPVIPAIPDRGR